MYYRTVNGQRISALGLGGLRFPTEAGQPNRIDRAEAQKVVDAAFQCGINCFDSAYAYQDGDSERFLGEALSKYPRDSYCLSTKYSVRSNPDMRAAFEEQLKRLRTDYVDFYLLHGLDVESYSIYTDPEKDYLGYLLRLKETGRVRHIGFSSHAAPVMLERFLDRYDKFDMALIQLNYLDWTLLEAKRQYELLTEHGIPVWAMEPVKGGRLSALNAEAAGVLEAAAPGRSIPSWGFRFLMGLPNVQIVLSGMSAVDQVLDNANTFSACEPLSEGELRALEQAAALFMRDLGVPCSACRYCCDACPEELDIPLLIRNYNERSIAKGSRRVIMSRKLGDASACRQCGACASHCPQGINIPEIMAKLAGE